MTEQTKKTKRDVSGWLVLDKPYDMTSTQAVGKVRWLFSAKKAGHAGTLDPLATGVLPIALGEATKTVPNIQDGEKLYRFTVKWGVQTATDDAEGDPIATSDVRPSAEAIATLLPRFTGEILQTPPAFSAIKIDGERAYDLARAGEAVELAARPVVIESFALIAHDGEASTFEVACQKGTYVRALARDMALALGTRGHVIKLHRAAVGAFTDARAISLAALEAATPEERDAMLLPVAVAGRGSSDPQRQSGAADGRRSADRARRSLGQLPRPGHRHRLCRPGPVQAEPGHSGVGGLFARQFTDKCAVELGDPRFVEGLAVILGQHNAKVVARLVEEVGRQARNPDLAAALEGEACPIPGPRGALVDLENVEAGDRPDQGAEAGSGQVPFDPRIERRANISG